MSYRETLHRWAAKHLPEGVKDPKITGVKIEHDEGHAYSEWTIEDPYLYVTITYTVDGETRTLLQDDNEAYKILVDMGALLTELFAIEES